MSSAGSLSWEVLLTMAAVILPAHAKNRLRLATLLLDDKPPGVVIGTEEIGIALFPDFVS
jgi:hypothetical protein